MGLRAPRGPDSYEPRLMQNRDILHALVAGPGRATWEPKCTMSLEGPGMSLASAWSQRAKAHLLWMLNKEMMDRGSLLYDL